jgi:hypothetical protein
MEYRPFIRKLIREELTSINEFEKFINEWSDFILNLSDYKETELKELYKDGINHIKHILNNNEFIYRGMAVNDKWLEYFKKNNLIKLGRFWSFDKSVSKSFLISPDVYDVEFGKFKGENKVFITAKTPNYNTIDINPTIAHNIVSSESELRLLNGATIEIVSININGNELDLSDKKFTS